MSWSSSATSASLVVVLPESMPIHTRRRPLRTWDFAAALSGAVRFLGQLVAPLESLTLGGGFEEGLAGSVVVVGAGEASERLRSCGGIDGCGRVGEHAGKR